MCVCNTWSSAALSLPALLLALSLSSDVDIHGTKLIPNYPNSGTHRSVVLPSCSGRERGASVTP